MSVFSVLYFFLQCGHLNNVSTYHWGGKNAKLYENQLQLLWSRATVLSLKLFFESLEICIENQVINGILWFDSHFALAQCLISEANWSSKPLMWAPCPDFVKEYLPTQIVI